MDNDAIRGITGGFEVQGTCLRAAESERDRDTELFVLLGDRHGGRARSPTNDRLRVAILDLRQLRDKGRRGQLVELLVHARNAVLGGVRLDDAPTERAVFRRVVHQGNLCLALALQVAEQLVGGDPGGLWAEKDIRPQRCNDRIRRALGNHRNLRRLDLIKDGHATRTKDGTDQRDDFTGDQFLDGGERLARVALIVLDREFDLRAIDAARIIDLLDKQIRCLFVEATERVVRAGQ